MKYVIQMIIYITYVPYVGLKMNDKTSKVVKRRNSFLQTTSREKEKMN